MKLAYSIEEAALATGLSEDSVRRAIRDLELPVHYAKQAPSKPLVKASDLAAWVDSWGTVKSPRKAKP